MKTNIFRIILIAAVVAALVGVQPGGAAQASVGGTGSNWVTRPPVLDGSATASEWGYAALITYTNFKVRFQNDDQFLYLLIDVIGEHPTTAPDAVSDMENFFLRFDTDKNGALTSNMDVEYTLNPAAPHNLLQRNYASGYWIDGVPSASYAIAGFGPSPATATPHRFYETAFRLSDLETRPGQTVKVGFWVGSTNPSFTESHPADYTDMSAYITLTLGSPAVAFIYNTAQGLTDAQAFQTVLADYGGFTTNLVALSQVASTDFNPYETIIVGHDTGDDVNHVWLGSSAAEANIKQSGKPVLGIGFGGSELFKDFGLYIGSPSSGTDNISGNVDIKSTDHAAWSFPNDLPKSIPFAVYSTTVLDEVTYTGPGTPFKKLTLLANHDTDSTYYPFIGEKLNGVCYTNWGFHSEPEHLTINGKKLFANMVVNPICLPSVLYLGGSDTTLRDGLGSMFDRAGFYTGHALASAASTLDLTDYGLIVVGWDTLSAWSTPANVNAIRNSHLPVLAMGEGGDHLFVDLGLSYNGTTPYANNLQTTVFMVNPLQAVMRAPYPIFVDSTYLADVDGASGVTEYLLAAKSPNQIGNLPNSPLNHSILTQAYNNTCYSFWGFENYVASMTVMAKNLFRNMAANPSCNYGQFMPIVHK